MLRAGLLVVIGLAVGLHLYQLVFAFDRAHPIAGLVFTLWGCVPYAVALALAQRAPGPALGFAVGALVGDAWMHHAVFVAPGSSTAALGLLFMPIYNMALLGPAGALLCWLLARLLAPQRSARQ